MSIFTYNLKQNIMDEKIKAMIEILELENYDLIHKKYYERFSLTDALEVVKFLAERGENKNKLPWKGKLGSAHH